MGLKELKPIDRIFFLQLFVAELVKNTAKERELKNKIEAEKIKIKYIQPQESVKLDRIGNSVIFNQKLEKSITQEKPIKEEITPNKHRVKLPKRITDPLTKNSNYLNLRKRPIESSRHPMAYKPSYQKNTPNQNNNPNLGKIDPLIQDAAVQMIECPGAGKNILVKARNKISNTRLALNESEIKNIINYFSMHAKIPIIGGILKAAVDNLIISAIVSEYVGSRFIINKKSPYQLIDR